LVDEIGTFYDEMLLPDQALFEATTESSPGERQTAGVVAILSDGLTVYAEGSSGLLRKVMAPLSPEALADLVNAVERPDQRAFSRLGLVRDPVTRQLRRLMTGHPRDWATACKGSSGSTATGLSTSSSNGRSLCESL